MTNPVSGAITQRDEKAGSSPRAFVMRYRDELIRVLPSHLHTEGEQEAWLRLATGALKTGRMTGGEFDLEVAARNNPQAFMQALRKAASLGLQPGSEQFYLTARKVKGRPEILGITGYRGIIELFYRAGYVASVVCEVVREKDDFEFILGRDERPLHKVDWFAPADPDHPHDNPRGKVVGAYGYAVMHGGATSRVIVLSEQQIQDVRKKYSTGSDSEYSPWQTNPDSMRLKTVVRRLQAWVPSSVEIRGRGGMPILAQAAQAVEAVPAQPAQPAQAELPVGQYPLPDHAQVQIDDPDEVIEAEVVPDPEPPAATEPEPTPAPAESIPAPTGQAAAPTRLDQEQAKYLNNLFLENEFKGKVDRLSFVQDILNDTTIKASSDLTPEQANVVIEALKALPPPRSAAPAEPAQ